jgi:hypothetical protein
MTKSQKVMRWLSCVVFAGFATAVFTFLAMSLTREKTVLPNSLFSGGITANADGLMLMCSLPMLLSTLALCKAWNINVRLRPRQQKGRLLIALPMAICGIYLVFVLMIIVVTSSIFFVVTLMKLFSKSL